MKNSFFDKKFDEATTVKLNLFRQYIREWLPVFMTRRKFGASKIENIHIYDFFAGPGYDSEGNPGSPLIIVEELKAYCTAMTDLKADVSVKMVFNDIKKPFVHKLKQAVAEIACDKTCCSIQFSNVSFAEALDCYLPIMNSKTSAHLVIMDQFGIKEVTPEVVRQLSRCQNTDILFFISTAFIYRFIEAPEIKGKFDLNADDRKDLEYNVIHRHLCDYYRKLIDDDAFYLVPFSIKKGSNIYGVMFGTKHVYGLEKFLKVCWTLDVKTGEANYNIDQDSIWHGQLSLFTENNKFKKIDLFEKELCKYLQAHNPDNVSLNKFCLSKGFSTTRAGEVLASLQAKGELTVWDIDKNTLARKKAFYLGWDNCKSGVGKVRFLMEKKP